MGLVMQMVRQILMLLLPKLMANPGLMSALSGGKPPGNCAPRPNPTLTPYHNTPVVLLSSHPHPHPNFWWKYSPLLPLLFFSDWFHLKENVPLQRHYAFLFFLFFLSFFLFSFFNVHL